MKIIIKNLEKSAKNYSIVDMKNVNVAINTGKDIEFKGLKRMGNDWEIFHQKFSIGDTVVYDSYNLTYTGKIVSIGKKTVKIIHYPDDPDSAKTQLRLNDFIFWNWDLDLEEINKSNSETSMWI